MILAIEATSPITKLWLDEKPEVSRPSLEWTSGRQLADDLLPQIHQLINESGASLASLTGIVLKAGPGSFTSLRIGHTVANALADSLAIPVVSRQGDNWLADGLRELPTAPLHQSVLPFYGGEANVTRPKQAKP